MSRLVGRVGVVGVVGAQGVVPAVVLVAERVEVEDGGLRCGAFGGGARRAGMAADNFTWQTDATGLLIVEYSDLVAVFDDANGMSSDGGAGFLRDLGFETVGPDLSIRAAPAGAVLELVRDDRAVLVLRLPDGRACRDAFRHDHREWAATVRSLGFAPTVVSTGGGLLPDATTDRIRRHAQVGDFLGGAVAASG